MHDSHDLALGCEAWVLAELGRRDLVPAIWLPDRWCALSGNARAGACTSSATAPA
jgi:hypothetical protein